MEYVTVFAQEILHGFSDSDMYILMLVDPVGRMQVPVIIGRHEADMIMLEHNSQLVKRPLTHQLVLSLCDTFHLELEKVTIDRYYEGVFFATLHVSDGVSLRSIDSRASDAICLALHKGIDILMNKEIIEETGSKVQPGDISQDYPAGGVQNEERTLQELEEELHRCEQQEDYERAAEINQQIEILRKKQAN